MEPRAKQSNQEVSSRPFREQSVAALSLLRSEWQMHACGNSLLGVQASVGLLLHDLVVSLQLNQQEKILALGDELVNEIEATIARPADLQIIQ